MHRLKSIFISSYMTALMAALVWAALHLAKQPGNLAYWGVVVASGAPMALFVRLFLAPVARIGANLSWIPSAGILGTVMALDLTDNYRIRPEPAEFIAALDRAGL